MARLKGFGPLAAVIGVRVYDNVPARATYPYVSLGESDIVPADSYLIPARDETCQIDVWSKQHGKKIEAALIVDLVRAAFKDWTTDIGDNALVSVTLGLSRVLRDPDGKTAHGVVQITGRIEEK